MWGRKLTNFEIAPSTVLGELQMKCLCKTVQITIETEPLLGCSQVAPGKSTVELISGDKPTSSSQPKGGPMKCLQQLGELGDKVIWLTK